MSFIDSDWKKAGYTPAGSLLQPIMWIAPVLFTVGLLRVFQIDKDHWLTIASLLAAFLLMSVPLLVLSFCRLFIVQSKLRQQDGDE